ncbi:hypothetical protein HAX54_033462 [Datura stramonium]|uniref:Uncharacterized protein n=1 Tax=Datura stramonium TaxID=4076 RepID=A0ABS8VCE9_DATST|nr:hypothetical protein [Datura stramonium]
MHKFKDNMTDQITMIDLVENEFDFKEAESYQDKIAKLEAKVAQMEQEIDGIKKMITDLKKSSIEESKGHSHICTTAYPNLESNAHHFPNMHSLSLKEAFNSLTEAGKNRENGRRHFNVELTRRDLLKRKSIESPESPKEKEPQRKAS